MQPRVQLVEASLAEVVVRWVHAGERRMREPRHGREQAVAFGEESLALRRAEEDRYGEAESLALLAAAASANGDEATSFALLRQSRGIRQAIGDRAGVAECDAELARIAAPA